MANVHEQERYDVAPDEMWSRIGDFHEIAAWHPAIASQDNLDDGRVRALHLEGGGTVTESLVQEGERTYTYRIDDSPLPVSDYTATISVREGDGGGCVIEWRADFQAVGASDEQAQEIVTGIFRGGLDALP
jgi:hypothetical protein